MISVRSVCIPALMSAFFTTNAFVAAPAMATAVKASVCEVLWTQVGLETIRAHAYDVLNKRDSVVQTALDDILVANPNRESTLYWYDVYDGIHRVLWGEILRQKLELPLTPSQQKALVKQAQQRVVEVYSTP